MSKPQNIIRKTRIFCLNLNRRSYITKWSGNPRMWIYLLQGIGYGLAAASQPGPFQTYIISQTLTRGWKRTLPAALAPLVSDGPIILLCVLVLSQVPAWMQRVLYIAGGLFILYLAYGTYKSWKNFDPSIPTARIRNSTKCAQSRIDECAQPRPLYFLDTGHRSHFAQRLARNTCQRDRVSGRLLYDHDRQPCRDHSCFRNRRATRAKGQPCLIGDLCNRIILFWVISIMAGAFPKIIIRRQNEYCSRPCACQT